MPMRWIHPRLLPAAALFVLVGVCVASAYIDVHTSRELVELNERGNVQNVEAVRLLNRIRTVEQALSDERQASEEFFAYMNGEIESIKLRLEDLVDGER